MLKCDLRKYFPSIDHELLKQEIRRKIGCRDTFWLADTIIDGSNPQEPVPIYFPGDDLFTPFERRKGLPIGNLTSQFFANVYLNRFDHFVKDTLGCRYYIRYVDDFVALSSDKAFLHEVAAAMEEFLSTLRLAIHPNKCHIFRADAGIDFLGYRVFRDHRLLRKSNVTRFRRKLRRMVEAYGDGGMGWEEIDRSVQSWLGHARFADTWGLRKRLFGECAFVKG